MALGWRGQYLRYKEFFLNILALYKKRADLKMFLEIILSMATIVVFSLFALKPTALTIISLVKEVQGKESLIEKLDQKISNLEKAREVFSQEQSAIPIIESAIPDSPSPDILVRQIEGLAAKNSVGILGISMGEVALIGNKAKEVSISISITSAYQNLNLMIKDIENLRIPVKIDTLGINANTAIISGKVPILPNEN